MSIHIPTIFVLVIVTTLALSLALGWVSQPGAGDGLRQLAGGFALESVCIGLLGLRGEIPDFISIVLANVGVTIAYALLLMALAELQRIPLSRRWLWWPAITVGLLFFWFDDNIPVRMVIISIVLLVFDTKLLFMLGTAPRKLEGRGQHLLIVGVVVHMAAVIARGAFVLNGSYELHRQMRGELLAQGFIYVAAFVSLILLGLGFVLMAKEAAEAQARKLAMQDSLTGTWNRVRIEAFVHQEMLRLKRYATPLSLILIDIDFFKQVNDAHGHIAGDAVLKAFAGRVKACIRDTDVLGRWGGEEFVVVLPSSGFAAAAEIAERIRAAMEEGPLHEGIAVTASVGFSSCQSTDRWEDWLGRADLALYRAKAAGRNRVESEMPLHHAAGADPAGAGLVELVWREEYLSGVDEIDTQHRELFARANRLLALVGVPDRASELGQEIRLFIASMRRHMEAEEALLAANACPGLADHSKLHQHLIARSLQLLESYEHKQLDIGALLHFVVYELTAQHLILEDRNIDDWLRSSTAAQDKA